MVDAAAIAVVFIVCVNYFLFLGKCCVSFN